MYCISNDLMFWVILSLATSAVNLCLIVALAVYIFMRKPNTNKEEK
jgi:hypothetical protein